MPHDPRSVLTRPAPPPDEVIRYGPLAEQVADVYGTGPVIVFLHGGFWRAEYDRVHARPLCADLAGRGYRAIALEYRRTSPHEIGWPHTFDDIRAGIQAAAAGQGVVVAGHSAGGHLALWAAAEPDLPIRGALGLAAVSDLRAAYRLDLDRGAVALLLGGGPEEVPDRYTAADPLTRRIPAGPLALIHGDQDRQVPVDFSRRYAARTGCPLAELVGVEHFALIDPLSAAWPTVIDSLARLIRAA